jgi:ATP-dependent protease HslVU (ClpYQ) peptidase subunit
MCVGSGGSYAVAAAAASRSDIKVTDFARRLVQEPASAMFFAVFTKKVMWKSS